MFYFHNARWIYLRPGRAISLDRKFNTVVTEASIKIDENVPADGKDKVRRAGWYYSRKRRFLTGKISRQTAKNPKNMKRPVKEGFTLIVYVKVWGRIRKLYSIYNCTDNLSIIYKLIDQELLLYVDP